MSENSNVIIESGIATLTINIEADVCDYKQTWKASSTVAAMQLATHYSREALGIGWSELSSKGALWVVSRLKVEFTKVPCLGDKIKVKAIPLPVQKFLYPWRFEFLNEEGILVGEGQALWNLMNSETRRIAIVPEIAAKVPDTYKLPISQCIPEAAEEIDAEPINGTLTPVYTDLDINGHTSHIKYIDWCTNAIGPEIMGEYSLRTFKISYLQEVRYGESVDTELRILNNAFSFSGYKGDSILFIVEGSLESR